MYYGILGPLQARDQEREVPLGGARQRAVLALLILHRNESVSTERLVDEIWDEKPPSTASKIVRNAVSQLRKELGDTALLTSGHGYVLHVADGELDVDRFEALLERGRAALAAGEPDRAAKLLREALALWRGPPLADLRYEPALQEEAGRLEERRLSAIEERIDADLALGRHHELIAELAELVAHDPLRERLRAQQMLALYRCGRQADALHAYSAARRHLVQELGIEPGPALRRLHQAILAQDPALGAPSAPPSAPRARQRNRRRIAIIASGTAVLAAAIGALLLTRGSGSERAGLVAVAGDSVAAIDPATNSVVAEVPVGAAPSHLAVGDGAVWVTNTDDQTVSRIDPATNTVRQTIAVGSAPGAIAVGEGGVWVANSLDRTLSWISPETNEVVKTISVGNGPSGVCVGGGEVWVANEDDRTVVRIDPRSGRRIGTVRLDDAPGELACGGGAVWASSESTGTVTEIGATRGNVIGATRLGVGVSALAFGDGALWVANPLSGTVSEIVPRRSGVARTVAFGPGDGPVAVAVGADAVWVSNQFAGTVARIDPRRGAIVRTLQLGDRPQGLALVGGAVWAGVRAAGTRHRGGTLRVLPWPNLTFVRTDFDPAAPAAYGAAAFQILGITNDGLTAFRRAGGFEGTRLVPDLAVALPDATDAGRTYTFEVRRGVRYSNGALVSPGDIRRGLERVLRAGSFGSGFYTSIVGVAGCIRHPRRCNLSRGIVVDDRAGTITFHLTAPDPEFLDELALDFAVAVPPGTGAPGSARGPPPATGPYVLVAGRSRGALRLVRNPHFRVWSSAAKPDGYADAITVQTGVDLTHAVRSVEQGRGDYVNVGSTVSSLPRGDLEAIFTRYAGQVHTSSLASTVYFWLNTREPPFNDADVRRAVNYAVDRRAVAALVGGPRFAHPTCQILPSNFPGYRPYCPYTVAPGPGRLWSAPDLARARRLIARSHTRGMRVTVWGKTPRFPAESRYLVRLLDELGYRASLRLVPETRIYDLVTDPRRHAQTGPQVFTADFPAASNFLGLIFSCHALASGDHVGLNWSRFCDRRTHNLIRRARRVPAGEQAASAALWGAVDREIVDQAAAVPLYNPKAIALFSRRAGNAQYSLQQGMLLDQLWVR